MTLAVFLGSLLGAMALGMPIALALLVCGIAMMLQMGLFDSQISRRSSSTARTRFP